ncbi:hypothetical protein K2173_018380 [Erythroxylum novogranatense]|uniref:Fe2OG dioxygenase domain-containing protein n=1 Tax=Erythroxylum novogranatense TaxID=1862640 RepID=A0AAV8UAH0_9ROSI|nr:hypothetical protein K2173_018380 [Erythroxylum novogranatense]
MTSTSKKMEEIQLKEGKNSVAENASNYDKAKEVKAFDDTKAGVKGLVDAGVTKIPRFFIHPHGTVKSSQPEKGDVKAQLPLIDFKGFESCRRATIVAEILKALEEWGIFQVVNHGISGSVMEEMIAGIRGFHEQPQELKREWYSRDTDKKVRYVSNGNLLSSKAPADWRDSIAFDFQDGEIDSQLFPPVCSIGCMEAQVVACHYYPVCPQPELTFGTSRHRDPSFLTLLLQDTVGGLQVRHQNQWLDVTPLRGALIVNTGDFMQFITNRKFESVEHRVVVGGDKARASVACFFQPSTVNRLKPYAAIKELLSDRNPPIYREISFSEFITYFRSKDLDETS